MLKPQNQTPAPHLFTSYVPLDLTLPNNQRRSSGCCLVFGRQMTDLTVSLASIHIRGNVLLRIQRKFCVGTNVSACSIAKLNHGQNITLLLG